MTLKPLRFIVLVLAASLAVFSQTAPKAASKAAPKAGTKAKAATQAAPKAAARKAPAKKASARKTTARRAPTPARQLTPERERVREIQQALTDRGYEVEPTGTWGPDSIAALKRFQEDHEINNLSGRGKLDPLTLIALGLGPKNGPPAPDSPEPPATPDVSEPPAPPTPNQEGTQP